MPVTQKRKPKGLPKRTGNHKVQHQRYYDNVRPERKLRRILAQNGEAAAREWATTHHAIDVLQKLITSSK